MDSCLTRFVHDDGRGCQAAERRNGYGGDTWSDGDGGDRWSDDNGRREEGWCEEQDGSVMVMMMAMAGDDDSCLLGQGRRRRVDDNSGCGTKGGGGGGGGGGGEEGEGDGSSKTMRKKMKAFNGDVGGHVGMVDAVGDGREVNDDLGNDGYGSGLWRLSYYAGCGRGARCGWRWPLSGRLSPFPLSMVTAAVLCVFLCCCTTQVYSQPSVLRISCGSNPNATLGRKNVWAQDRNYIGGTPLNIPANLSDHISANSPSNILEGLLDNWGVNSDDGFPLSFPWWTCRSFSGNNSSEGYNIPFRKGEFVMMRLHFAFLVSSPIDFKVHVNDLLNVSTVAPRSSEVLGYSFQNTYGNNSLKVITKEFLFYTWQPIIKLRFSSDGTTRVHINAIEVITLNDTYRRLFAYSQLQNDTFLRLEGRINCGGGHVVSNSTNGNPFWWDSDSWFFSKGDNSTWVSSDSMKAVERNDTPWVPGRVWGTQRVFMNSSIAYGIESEAATQYFLILYFLDLNDTNTSNPTSKPIADTIDINVDGVIVIPSYKVFSGERLPIFVDGFPKAARRSIRLSSRENQDKTVAINGLELYSQLQALGSSVPPQNNTQKIPYYLGNRRNSDPCLSPIPQGYICNFEYGQRPTVVACNITGRESGEGINTDILNFVNLTTLVLKNNTLTGKIPLNISKLRQLKILDLSENNLMGSIPEELADIEGLQSLFLNNNNLSGAVPERLLQRHQLTFKYYNNDGLCLLSENCTKSDNASGSQASSLPPDGLDPNTSSASNPPSPDDPTDTKLSKPLILALSLVLLVIGGTVVAIVMVAQRMPKRDKPMESPSPSVRLVDRKGHKQRRHHNAISGMQPYCQVFTYLELKKATNNFSDELGRGNFGRVYKGVLTNNQAVAVKIRKDEACSRQSEFVKEIKTLSALNHKNLVRLIGYCSEGKVQALVYEYVGNGNLEQRLREGKLDWQTRLKISLGAAYAVEYLHTQAYPAVIHRDIKPANIMLDENFEAKVTDFGLSRVIIREETITMSETDVRGSTGYLDPDYASTAQLTKASDVYGLGVVILQLITGKGPIVYSSDGNSAAVADWARPQLMLRTIDSIIDPRMSVDPADMESIWVLADCAMLCCEPYGRFRPVISKVARAIEMSLEVFKEPNNLGTIPCSGC